MDGIAKDFECNICTKVLRDPRLTDCCGQHYCDSCLTKWLETQKTCPHCRKEKFQNMINKAKNREVKELRIRCTNSMKGCNWVGELRALDNHLKSDKGCGYMIVKCSNRGMADKLCGESLERRHLTSHKKNECKYRPYTCEYCGHKDTYEKIAIGYEMQSTSRYGTPTWVNSHHNECDNYPLECTNKCGKTNIKRKDMKGHHAICPLESLKCRFNAKGCSKIVLLRDMESHKRECDYRPYSCKYCGHHGTFKDIIGIQGGSSHYDNCDQYPLECRNKCSEKKIKKRDMDEHCLTICPLEPLKCPFNAKVCRKNILRNNMESHKRQCDYRPYSCEYCGHCGTFRDIKGKKGGTSHYDNCDQYPLKCPNECGETNIKRKNMKGHCDICPLEPVECPINAKVCRKNILRKNMESHKRECDYRPYSCEYCGHHGTFRDIKGIEGSTSHYDNCDEYPLECSNKCSEKKIKRRDMKAHTDMCLLEHDNCPFKDAGCTDKIQRKDMKKHIESNTKQHLMMAFESYQEVKEANQKVMEASRETRGELIFFLILYMLLYIFLLLCRLQIP